MATVPEEDDFDDGLPEQAWRDFVANEQPGNFPEERGPSLVARLLGWFSSPLKSEGGMG
jgi:hypothetical protein